MMRLICNGVALDLLEGATLSFKKINPLFAFDNLSCERTQAFDLPGTANNERILQLAKVPAFRGEGMRRRYDCEMQNGTVVKRGYLYVDSYEKNRYKAIFVTGELVGLQRIRDLGKLSEIVHTDAIAEYGGETFTPTDAIDSIWANVNHKRSDGVIAPSVLVSLLTDLVVSQNDLKPIELPSEASGLRIIPAVVHGLTDTPFVFHRMIHPYPSVGEAIVYDSYIGEVVQGSRIDDYFSPVLQTTRTYDAQGNPKTGDVILQATKIDMILTFPQDFPDNYFIVTDVSDGVAEFAGGYSFAIDPTTRQILRYGEPLAGREIAISKDTPFIIVKDTDRTLYGEDYYGWLFAGNFTQEMSARAAEENATAGDIVRLQDSLPDITFVDLMKSIAAITGYLLNYTDADGLTFERVDVEQFNVIQIDNRVIDVGDISRKFADYARNNIINFDSGDNVVNRLATIYTIDNDNIKDENVLQRIPFSEGDLEYTNDGAALVRIVAPDGEADKDVIADSGDADFLLRVTMMRNSGIDNLCDQSTSMTVSIRMTLQEYEALSAKTILLYDGTRYVWTEATWQRNVCKAKIAKI